MRDWLYKISLTVAGVFVAYLLVVRVFITWVQYAPSTAIAFVETISHSEISVDQINLDQNWLGVTFEVKGLHFQDASTVFSLQRLSGDFNIFSPLLPQLKYGRRLVLSHLLLTRKSQPGSDFALPKNLDMSQQLKDVGLQKLWKSIKIDDVQLTFHQKKSFTLDIKFFQSFFGLKWNFVGLCEIATGQQAPNEVQVKGAFSTNIWNLPREGEGSVSILQPIKLKDFYHFLSNKVASKLPSGELVGDVKFNLKEGKLSRLRTYATIQDLSWSSHDKLLPKSIGLNLKLRSKGGYLGKNYRDWVFELERLRFDDQYVNTISPVYMSLTQNKNLSFSAEKFKLHEIKPLFDVILQQLNYQGAGKELRSLALNKLKGVFNFQTARLDKLSFKLPAVVLEPQNDIPGLTIKDLSFEKIGRQVDIRINHPVELTSQYLKAGKPIRFSFAKTIHLQVPLSNLEKWVLPKTSFDLDGMQGRVSASVDNHEKIDATLDLHAGSLQKVKTYLPYPLMSKELASWLKNALVQGENVRASADFKGKLSDFPFKDNKGSFKAVAYVDHTKLQFQPDWPAVQDFSAKVEFRPYDLKITSSKARLMAVTAKNIAVDIKHLETKNIAVEIAGQANAKSSEALVFFNQTPIAKKLGLKSFLESSLTTEGQVDVELKRIWIPVYGFAKKSETVNGVIDLKHVNAKLFDQIQLNDLQGKLHFSESQLYSKGVIQGQFLSGKLQARVSTQKQQVVIDTQGKAKLDNNGYMSGAFPWDTRVQIPFQKKQPLKIKLNADLKQLTSHLPAPLNKLASTPDKANVGADMAVKQDWVHAKGHIGDVVKFYTDWQSSKSTPQNLKLIFGPTNKALPRKAKGYSIEGRLAQLNVDGWNEILSHLSKSDKPSDVVRWKASSLQIQQLKLGKHNLHHVNLNWNSVKRSSQKEPFLALKLKADEAALVMTKSDTDAFNVNLAFLKLVKKKKKQAPEKPIVEIKPPAKSAETQNKNWVEPQCALHENSIKLSKIHFVGTNIQIEDRKISKLSFNLSDSDKTIVLSKLHADFSGLHTRLDGVYRYNKQQNKSFLRGDIHADNVEQLSALLGIHKGFKGKDGRLDMHLSWAGAYDCYSPVTIKGKVNFSLHDGVIVNAEPGIARVLGLLSFESLARRLKLDVSDVTDKGLAYDSIKGHGAFNRGVFDLEKLELKAPAASGIMFGQINLVQKDMSLKADITPAIGESIPALAALSGVATPLAGLAAYALLKVIPIVNADLVTYRYDVTGSFVNPKVKERGLNLDLIRLKGQSSIKPTPLIDSD